MGKASVDLTDEALFQLTAIPGEKEYTQVTRMLGLLADFPELGEQYDPLFASAPIPSGTHVLYAGHYGIYYLFEKDAMVVLVISIDDQRRNPRMRYVFTDER